MNECNGTDANAQRMLIGALIVLCNTISALVVILTRRNGKNDGPK